MTDEAVKLGTGAETIRIDGGNQPRARCLDCGTVREAAHVFAPGVLFTMSHNLASGERVGTVTFTGCWKCFMDAVVAALGGRTEFGRMVETPGRHACERGHDVCVCWDAQGCCQEINPEAKT